MLPTSEDVWDENRDPTKFANNYGSLPMMTVRIDEAERFLDWAATSGKDVDIAFKNDLSWIVHGPHRRPDHDDLDEEYEIWATPQSVAQFTQVIIDLDREAVDEAIAAAKRILRCRVCGVTMTPANTIDPIELPDECTDCAAAEGMFF